MKTKEELVVFIWKVLAVVLVGQPIIKALFNTVQIFSLSNGTKIEFEVDSFSQIILVCAAYYLSKLILFGKSDDKDDKGET